MKVDTARVLGEHKLERLARASSDTVTFWKDATEILRGVIPFDFHPCWFTIDPTTLLVTGHLNEGLDRTPPEIARAWYAEGDVNSPVDLVRLRGGVSTVRRATRGDPAASWRWRHLLHPLGFDDSLDAVLRTGRTVWGAVTLLHTDGSRPFTAEDVRFMARLGESLAIGTRLGLLRSEVADGSAGGPAVLVVSSDLVADSTTENADRWLADLPDIGSFRPDRLPMPVQVVVLRALRSDTGEAGMTVRSKSGTWVRIHGSRLGGSGDVAVVVDVATPDQLAPVRMAGYNLTTREQQVVDLVLRGRSTQQVADELFISQYTVQDRLKGIFEKVGVRSRRELVATIRVSELEPRIAANDERVRDGRPLRR